MNHAGLSMNPLTIAVNHSGLLSVLQEVNSSGSVPEAPPEMTGNTKIDIVSVIVTGNCNKIIEKKKKCCLKNKRQAMLGRTREQGRGRRSGKQVVGGHLHDT
ncbi:hypothetical protein E2C01_074053 [Portunus trituberculatus]|uniref:Uncharacterized protein n=1 Tax=Portunus trituberculatus TaxID=210409 RepID=A0A5B7IFX0_PORTR|nr:hypothetical protein [Portunus trituberculatus]